MSVTLTQMISKTKAAQDHVNDIGKEGIIDGAGDVKVTVVEVLFSTNRVQYSVSWFNNGSLYTQWVDAWRWAEAQD